MEIGKKSRKFLIFSDYQLTFMKTLCYLIVKIWEIFQLKIWLKWLCDVTRVNILPGISGLDLILDRGHDFSLKDARSFSNRVFLSLFRFSAFIVPPPALTMIALK
jgi:hypothetical protein